MTNITKIVLSEEQTNALMFGEHKVGISDITTFQDFAIFASEQVAVFNNTMQLNKIIEWNVLDEELTALLSKEGYSDVYVAHIDASLLNENEFNYAYKR